MKKKKKEKERGGENGQQDGGVGSELIGFAKVDRQKRRRRGRRRGADLRERKK